MAEKNLHVQRDLLSSGKAAYHSQKFNESFKMKVYRVKPNLIDFSAMAPLCPPDEDSKFRYLNCASMLREWSQPDIRLINSQRPLGNIIGWAPGYFVTDSLATEVLRTNLEMAGEILPLKYSGKDYSLINVLECVNCLDERKTKWTVDGLTGQRVSITEYHFRPSRFPDSSLFKIPETSGSEILTISGRVDPEDEFKFLTETARLKGVCFEHLWTFG